MNAKQRMLQKDYAFYVEGLRDVVLCLWENRASYPVNTYNTYRNMLHKYVDEIEKIIEQTKEEWNVRKD